MTTMNLTDTRSAAIRNASARMPESGFKPKRFPRNRRPHLSAETVVEVAAKKRGDYLRFVASCFQHWGPAGVTETFLVEGLASIAWKLHLDYPAEVRRLNAGATPGPRDWRLDTVEEPDPAAHYRFLTRAYFSQDRARTLGDAFLHLRNNLLYVQALRAQPEPLPLAA